MSFRINLLILFGILIAGNISATAAIRRHALVVGANNGGSNRPILKYAVTDAKNFARVMESLGGVHPSDLVLMDQPTLIELEDALEELRHRIKTSHNPSQKEEAADRIEVIVYISGHANETGLLLGKETFSYRSLRNWMDLVEADVRIAVLDACASGTITRLKGSQPRSPFMVDTSSDMRGYAFLTSSSAEEASQESDHIGGSFFTHYLVSGLRGAADTSGEGKVTLNEAYQFAFNETLDSTTETRAGTQHPSYDINLAGTGEVVMTDIRVTSAILALDKELSGRFFIRNSDEQLEVELYKQGGRSIELGLEPGRYKIQYENESGSFVSTAVLKKGGRLELSPQHFDISKQKPTVIRGDEAVRYRFGSLGGRWRLGARLGLWNSGGIGSETSNFVYSSNNTTGGIVASYWLNDKWSLDFSAWTTMSLVKSEHLLPDSTGMAAFLFGGKRYFPYLGGLRSEIKPYLSAAGGLYLRRSSLPDGGKISHRAAGGNVGGGFDFQLSRWCMIGTKAGYNFTSDFTDDFTGTFGDKTSYRGFEFGIDFSFLLGK